MNKLKETVALALEALKKSTPANIDDGEDDYRERAWERRLAAIKALKELVEQPEQKPLCTAAMFDDAFLAKSGLSPDTKLYTDPQQRKPLTDEDIARLITDTWGSARLLHAPAFARSIERAHGIGGEE